MLILYTKGMCNKIIRKLNNFPVKHRRTEKFLNYLSHKNSFLFALHIINISKWTVSAQFTFITMLIRWLFSRFCFAKRHQTKQSRCMFSRISECHANFDWMYPTMGCFKKKSLGKGILGTVVPLSAADEKQGRKSLHRHWQIWVKEIIKQYGMVCSIKTLQ